MADMRLGWCLLAIAPLLASCGDAYYQTRYVPVSVEDTYSVAARATWTGDREVYEIPAAPPAIDTERPRRPCLPPEQRFKPDPMLGLQESTHVHEVADVQPLAAMGDVTPHGLPALKAPPIYAWMPAEGTGAHEPHYDHPVGVMDRGPVPFDIDHRHADGPRIAGWRTDETDWCAEGDR